MHGSELKEMMVTQPKSKTIHMLVAGSPVPGIHQLNELLAKLRRVPRWAL